MQICYIPFMWFDATQINPNLALCLMRLEINNILCNKNKSDWNPSSGPFFLIFGLSFTYFRGSKCSGAPLQEKLFCASQTQTPSPLGGEKVSPTANTLPSTSHVSLGSRCVNRQVQGNYSYEFFEKSCLQFWKKKHVLTTAFTLCNHYPLP